VKVRDVLPPPREYVCTCRRCRGSGREPYAVNVGVCLSCEGTGRTRRRERFDGALSECVGPAAADAPLGVVE